MSEGQRITMALGGKWYGDYGTAACPICQPNRRKDQNALGITDGENGILLNCKRSHCNFREILRASGTSPLHRTNQPAERWPRLPMKATSAAIRNSRYALRIWDQALPVTGTPADAYLRSRAITKTGSDALRFHPAVWNQESKTNFPALVARVDGGAAFAINRTFLFPDGKPLGPKKTMLGPCAGGHVPLVWAPRNLVIAEGIETALSLACGLLETEATVWATLTAANMRKVVLPAQPSHLTIATDGDPTGRKAGAALAERARSAGWSVTLMQAPDGQDWNDVLRARSKN